MKLNLHPKVIPKDTPPAPLTKGGVVVGMKKEGDKEKIYLPSYFYNNDMRVTKVYIELHASMHR